MSIQERIENVFTKVNEEIAALKYELKGNKKSVREELNEATKSLNATWEGIDSLQEKNRIEFYTTATRQHRRRECEVKGGA